MANVRSFEMGGRLYTVCRTTARGGYTVYVTIRQTDFIGRTRTHDRRLQQGPTWRLAVAEFERMEEESRGEPRYADPQPNDGPARLAMMFPGLGNRKIVTD